MSKYTPGPLEVRMSGTCSGAWAEVVQRCIDPTGAQWFRELGQTNTTHVETQMARRSKEMPGDINEAPERFELTVDGHELIANAYLWAAAPELLEALRAAEQALRYLGSTLHADRCAEVIRRATGAKP